jgi:hypothetical protein
MLGSTTEQVKLVNNPTGKGGEEDYETVNEKIKDLTQERNGSELKEVDSDKLIKYIRFIMEHPERIVLDTTDSVERNACFSALFDELPTYSELLDGTPKLRRIFNLKP